MDVLGCAFCLEFYQQFQRAKNSNWFSCASSQFFFLGLRRGVWLKCILYMCSGRMEMPESVSTIRIKSPYLFHCLQWISLGTWDDLQNVMTSHICSKYYQQPLGQWREQQQPAVVWNESWSTFDVFATIWSHVLQSRCILSRRSVSLCPTSCRNLFRSVTTFSFGTKSALKPSVHRRRNHQTLAACKKMCGTSTPSV